MNQGRATKLLSVLAITLACIACSAPGNSPTGPTPLPQPVTASAVPLPTGPPFSVTLAAGSSPLYPGRSPIIVTVIRNIGLVSAEPPTSVQLTCAGRTITQPIGGVTTEVLCDFPEPATYPVQATVTGAAGFSAITGTSVTVIPRPPAVLDVFYSVIETFSDGSDVVFSTRNVDGAAHYRWNFGDGTESVSTLLSMTRHRFFPPSIGINERIVMVTATDANGRTVATGRVIGRW